MSTTPEEFRGADAERGNVIAFPSAPVPGKDVQPAAPIVDAELVDEPEQPAPAIAVDTPVTDGSSWLERLRRQDRQPVIPGYLKSVADAKDAAKWVGKHYAHKTGYHAVRSPLYALKLAVRSPRGLLLLLAATGRYVTDAQGRQARSGSATAAQAEPYL